MKWSDVRPKVRATILATMNEAALEWRGAAGTAMEEHIGEAIERADAITAAMRVLRDAVVDSKPRRKTWKRQRSTR